MILVFLRNRPCLIVMLRPMPIPPALLKFRPLYSPLMLMNRA